MTRTRTGTWIAGTAVLAVLIVIAGWLLLVTPQRSEAAELREAAVMQRTTNVTLQVRLDELVAKSADLPALQARLSAVRSRLPEQAELPELIRLLTTSASSAGLNLTGIVPSVPQLISAADPAAAPTSDGLDAGTPAPVTDPTVASGEQLYAIEVSMTLTGRYAGVSSYVNALEELTRSFQVTGFTLGEDTTDGVPKGSVQLSVQGRVFVLSSGTPEVAAPVPGEPVPSPVPTDIQPTAPAVAN